MKRKRVFFASCVNYPNTAELFKIVDREREISKRTFLKHCEIRPELRKDMKRFPNDYSFYKSRVKGKPVYFYSWSMIEHIFK